MDDLEFRRSVYADPHSEDPKLKQTAKDDPTKLAFLKELRQFDQQISAALKVPVPENLADRLIMRQTIASHKQQQRKFRIHVGLAASVAFAIGLTVQMLYAPLSPKDIGYYSLAHVHHGINHLVNAHEQNSVAQVNAKLARFGGKFSADFGNAVFANYCDFRGVTSLHLIFESDQGRVSVFVTPVDADLALVEQFGDERFIGQVFKFEKALVTVVGDKDKPLTPFANRVKDNLNWEI